MSVGNQCTTSTPGTLHVWLRGAGAERSPAHMYEAPRAETTALLTASLCPTVELYMRVALYCRVSTKDQSSEMQLRDLCAYCVARQFVAAREYVDLGQSGTKDSRPQLNELIGDARKRKLDAVIVWRFDRFARSTKHLLCALEEFLSLGVGFISYQENIETGTRWPPWIEGNAETGEGVTLPLGRVVGTPGALRTLEEAGVSPATVLARHANGDWGELDDHDRRANEYALKHDLRVLPAYTLRNDQRIWIITEADRSSTTILLPEEY